MRAAISLQAMKQVGFAALVAGICTVHGSAIAQADTAEARRVSSEVNLHLPRLTPISIVVRRPEVEYPSYVRAWADQGIVRKIEATDHDDDGDVVTKYYYEAAKLVFAYQAIKGFNNTGKQVTRGEERQYFRDGRMFKWLSGLNRADRTSNAGDNADFSREEKSRLGASDFFVQAVNLALQRRTPQQPTKNPR